MSKTAFFICIFLLASCEQPRSDAPDLQSLGQQYFTSFDTRVDTLLAQMTLDEKVGQMTQPDQEFLNDVDHISEYFLGSLLSGGGSDPETNSLEDWTDLYERYQAKALETGNYLKVGLKNLAANHPIIGDIRGNGLFLGIDLVRDQDTREPATGETHKAVNLLRHQGVLIGSTGQFDNILKIRPPMVFSKENADLLLQKLKIVLNTLSDQACSKPGHPLP